MNTAPRYQDLRAPKPPGDSEPPLVFIWLGEEFPRYGIHAVKQARAAHAGEIVVLTDHIESVTRISGCQVIDVKEFRPQEVESFRAKFQLDPNFRDGLWWKAYERLFILGEYARQKGVDRGFHAELDVWLTRLEGFADALDNFSSGIFLPAASSNTVIASLIYWNSIEIWTSLFEFLLTNAGHQNEMNALSEFLNSSPLAHTFATEGTWASNGWPYSDLSVSAEEGIVDSAGIGMWFLGRGPATTRTTVWNKHRRSSASSIDMPQLRIRGIGGGKPTVGLGRQQFFPLRALHVPSKIHAVLRFRFLRIALFKVAALPFRFPIRFRTYFFEKKSIRLAIQLLWRLFARTPSGLSRVAAIAIVWFCNLRQIELPDSDRVRLKDLCTTFTDKVLLSVRWLRGIRDLNDEKKLKKDLAENLRIFCPGKIDINSIERFVLGEDGRYTRRSTMSVGPLQDALSLSSHARDESVIRVAQNLKTDLVVVLGDTLISLNLETDNKNVSHGMILSSDKNLLSRSSASLGFRTSKKSQVFNFHPSVQVYSPRALSKIFTNPHNFDTWKSSEATLADVYGLNSSHVRIMRSTVMLPSSLGFGIGQY